jgi:NaMN:DMB phosphoribosyltransferase
MAAAQGLIQGFPGDIILCGATQMSAVALLAKDTRNVKDIGNRVTCAVTDCVWEDSAADVAAIADLAGIPVTVSPVPTRFVQKPSPSRACIRVVKEGFGAGGALAMARRHGYAEEKIEAALAATIRQI